MWYAVFVFMLVFAIIGASYVYYDLKCGVPTWPTGGAMQREIIALLREDSAQRGIAAGYKVVDLGSGSGTLCHGIARALPYAVVEGVEISFVPWLRSVLRCVVFGPRNQTFHRSDFWSYDIRAHHAIIVYLIGAVMDKMSKKLLDEATPGTLIISNRFPLTSGWQPYEVRTPKGQGLLENKLYLYRKA